MGNAVKVSVLMSVYNEKDEWLRLAIESILNRKYTNFEFIIINDNPTDERINIILSEYAARDARIVIVRNEHNMVLVASLNHGLQFVTDEYVARMDADDTSHPDRLEKQFTYITETDADLISSCIDIINENGDMVMGNKDSFYDFETTKQLMKYVNPLPHPLWFGKREVFEKLGGYRNVHSAEDYDFLIRAIERGFHICVSGDVLLDYRKRSSGISKQNSLRQFIVSFFIVDDMDTLSDISPEEIEKYVSSKLNKRDINAFAKVIENKHPGKATSVFRMTVHTSYSLLISKYAFGYFYNALKARQIKSRYKKSMGC